MSTPDKCPYCGDPRSDTAPGWYKCGSNVCGDQSDCCRECVAHAETKRELEMWKHNAGTAVTVAIEHIQAQRDAAEARVRELEDAVTCAGYAAQKLRKSCGLDDTKEDLMEVAETFDRLQARVRELEGLALQVVNAWKAFDLAEGDWERTDSERSLSNSIDTLGEAMPRREEK